MRLLANENFPLLAVTALRTAGHDVLWARSDMPGESDEAVLDRAQRENRLVLTFDKGFGEMAFRWGLPATCGIIVLRLRTQSPEHVRDLVVDLFAERDDWAGRFWLLEEHRLRSRPLPRSSR
jgi:predicted nuclease of predicted toxin-antitoxin system